MCVPGARIRKGAFTKSSSFLLSFICEPMFKRQKLLKDLEMKLRFCGKYTADRKTLVGKNIKKNTGKNSSGKISQERTWRKDKTHGTKFVGQNSVEITHRKCLFESTCSKVTSIKSIWHKNRNFLLLISYWILQVHFIRVLWAILAF